MHNRFSCEPLERRQLLAATFAELGVVDTPGLALASERVGNIVFVADQDAGLSVYDVTTPLLPVQIAVFQTDSHAFDVTVRGNLAYVGLALGLQILDISNLSNIRTVGGFTTTDNVRTVEVRDSEAFLGSASTLTIVNVANPAAPTLLSRLSNIGASRLELAGNYLYAADSTRGLRAVNITNPVSPQLATTLLAGFNVVDVEQQGGFLYVATSNNGISTYSIAADPGQPVLLGQTPISSQRSIRSMDMVGPNLFIGTNGSLLVLDGTNPQAITTIGEFPLVATAINDVSVSGGSILVSTGGTGVRLLEARDDIGTMTDGIVRVLGTSAGDNFFIRQISPWNMIVARNGLIESFSPPAWRPEVAGVIINGVAGADTISAANLAISATVGGGSGADTITTGSGRDLVRGGRGSDTINTNGNADTVFGDDGADFITGGSGDDYLIGGAGGDTLRGGMGDDAILGGADDDSILGGAGNDSLYGQLGNDTLIGKAGADLFYVDEGRNTVLAQDGTADTIFASSAEDVLSLDTIDVLMGQQFQL